MAARGAGGPISPVLRAVWVQTPAALGELRRLEAAALADSRYAQRLMVAAHAQPATWVPCAQRSGTPITQ
eukprot:4233348-Prymnesium_polylepis.1